MAKGKPAVRVETLIGETCACSGDHSQSEQASVRIHLRNCHAIDLCRRCAKNVGAWLMRTK